MELNINTITLRRILSFYWTLNKRFIIPLLLFMIGLDVNAQYPSSTSMLTKYNNKYYLKSTGELFSGRVVNLSKKTWKKILETHLANGMMHGVHREWYPHGVLKYKGNFVYGKREGEFHSYYPNGRKMSILNYKGNVIDSISVSYTEKGMIKMNHNHNTDLVNIWDYSDSPKSFSKYTKQFGKLNGVFNKWDNYGRKVEEGYYNKDKKDSVWLKYNSKGLVYEKGKFKNDKKEGVWSNFDQYGRPSSKSYFSKGILDSIKNIVYFMDGNEYAVKNYNIKSRENVITTFDQRRNKVSETKYIGSALTGESVKWFDNGQIEYRVNFLNNKLNGLAEYWNQDGSKHKSGEFKNGKIMGEWEYFNISKLDSNLNARKR